MTILNLEEAAAAVCDEKQISATGNSAPGVYCLAPVRVQPVAEGPKNEAGEAEVNFSTIPQIFSTAAIISW
jgi:hypothetical protein